MRAAIAALALLLLASASARDNGQYGDVDPAIRAWIEGLRNHDGVGCCATADGIPAEAEWDTQSNHYRVRLMGEWVVVPDEAVITEPNRLGHAVVWFYTIWDAGDETTPGHMVPRVRCFLPGGGT